MLKGNGSEKSKPNDNFENPAAAAEPVRHAMPELAASRDPAARHVLRVDVETRSRVNIKTVGGVRYAADPSTECSCLGYAVDDELIQLWAGLWAGDPVPPEFFEAATNPLWTVEAHNAAFERAIWRYILEPRWGFPAIPIERWRCTMARAYAAALPGALDKAAEALGLPITKDKVGKLLMLKMSKPRRGDDGWIEDQASQEGLYRYLRQDVETQRAVSKALPELTAGEQELWCLDARINDRGFAVDVPLLEAAERLVTGAQSALQAEFASITGLNSTHQVAGFVAWLAAQDCTVTDVQKGTLRHALRRKGLVPPVRRAIELRLQLAHASAAKVNALLAWRGADDRVRGSLVYHGASTGRWVGRGPQPQNFKRDVEDADVKVAAILAGGDSLDSPVEAVGDVARCMIIAAPGSRLMVGDFSGIESRGLAWISGQQSKLDQWAKFDRTGDPNDDPYVIGGRSIGHPESTARAYGKVWDLAFGYQGGVYAWQNFAPEDDTSDEETIKHYRDEWRRQHLRTVQFWSAVDRAAVDAVRHPGKEYQVGRSSFCFEALFLRITLPSGRSLSYPYPRIGRDNYRNPCVIFKDNAGGWIDCNHGKGAYGGIWTENIVSGIARDLLAAGLKRLEEAGYPVALHVHDEIICEVPAGHGDLDEFRRLLVMPPAWAAELPLAAKVREGRRFGKSIEATAQPKKGNGVDAVSAAEIAPSPAIEPVVMARSTATYLQSVPPLVDAGATGSWIDVEPADHPEPSPGGGNGGGGGRGNGHDPHGDDGYSSGEEDFGEEVAFYIYRQADGSNYLGVKRTSTKQFPQYHWNGKRWLLGAPKGPKIPYRLPELIKAPHDEFVMICAGEKDAETAARLGYHATCNPEGERKGAWKDAPELNVWFTGRSVVIVEDNDATGYAHALEVANALRGIVNDIHILRFRDLPEHGDLTDWIELGNNDKALWDRIAVADPFIQELNEWDAGERLGEGKPPPRQWLYGKQLCRRFTSSLIAPGDAGKTTKRLTQAIELATKRELLGHRLYQRCRVLVISFEDDDDEIWRRLLAICLHYHIDPAELKGWLFCSTVKGAKLVELNNGERVSGELEPMLRSALQRLHPDVLILDPFVKLHALNESDNPDMDFVCSLLAQFAHEYNIALDSPAHTRKGALTAGDSDNRRGASAQRDASRLDYTLTTMTEAEAKNFGIDVDERKQYVRLDKAKANIVRAMKATWYHLVSIPIGNATELYPEGDEVQALEVWEPPEVWEDLDTERINRILDKIDAGLPNGSRYSDAPNAKARAAWYVVIEVVPGKPAAQAREIIKAWVKDGLLYREKYHDDDARKEVDGLYVNQNKRPAA